MFLVFEMKLESFFFWIFDKDNLLFDCNKKIKKKIIDWKFFLWMFLKYMDDEDLFKVFVIVVCGFCDEVIF